MIKATSKYFVLVFFICLFFCVWFFSNTYAGLDILCRNVSKVVPGQLSIELNSGSLNQEMNIKHFSYQLHALKIQGTNIALQINLAALILNDLNIDKLHAEQLSISLPKGESKQSAVQTPHINMPLKIYANDVAVQHFSYQRGASHFQLNKLHFNAAIRPNGIDLTPLTLTLKKTEYQLRGNIVFAPLRARFRFIRQQQQVQNINALLTASGNWQNMQLNSQVSLPINLTTHIQLDNVLSRPTWQATGNVTDLGILTAQRFMGNFNAKGNVQTLTLAAQLHSEQKNDPGTIELNLASKSLAQQQLQLNLAWENLLLQSKPRAESLSGTVNVMGTPQHYKLEVATDVQGEKVPNTQLSVVGEGDTQQLTLQHLALKTLQGSAEGTAQLNWKSDFNYQLGLMAKNIKPETKWVNWPGDISSQLTLNGDAQHLSLKLFNLKGDLRGQPLSGSLDAKLHRASLSAADGDMMVGAAHLAAHYTAKDDSNLRWDLNIPALEKIFPMAQGQLVSEGSLTLHNNFIATRGRIAANELTWQQYHVDNFSSQFAINTNPKLASTITLNSKNIRISHYQFQHIDMNLSGKNPSRKFDLSLQTEQGILFLNATSNLLDKDFQFNVSRLNLQSKSLGNWNLINAFKLRYHDNHINLHDFKWRANKQQINADLIFHNKKLRELNVQIKNLALNLFNFVLPTNIKLAGRLNLNSTYTLKENKINSEGTFGLVNSKILYPFHHQEQQLRINQAQIGYSIKDNALASQTKLHFNDNNTINLSANVSNIMPDNFWQQTHVTSGEMSSTIPNLKIIQAFLPGADKLSGQLNTQFKWNGTLLRPNLMGQISLLQGEIKLLAHGVDLKKLNLQIAAAKQQVNYKLTTESGKGHLTINGHSLPNKLWRTKLNIQGEDFAVDNTPHFKIAVSPNLQLILQKQRIDLTGKISFPRADIDLLQYSNVSSLPSDVEIIQAGTAQTNNSWSNYFYTTLNVELGKDVQLKTKLLSASLAGNIQLTDSPHSETTANGELTIPKGIVSAFGQKLSITNGKLLYAGGATTNPGLKIQATKTIKTFVDPNQNSLTNTGSSNSAIAAASQQVNVPMQRKNILVGVSVTHTLQQPHITLFSDQSDLTQADILSYLVLGYPMNKANNQQGEALLQAANALTSGDGQVSGLVSAVRNKLELNEVGFQSNNYLNPATNTVQENTSLVLGKMLSPKLFIRYSIGLILPINTLSASYSFDKNWSLQTESNSLGNGVDLLYSWEHN
jgi:translocation and assembly module TamB